jgi:hypothetical protein
MGRLRAVVRGDGRRFPSITDALRETHMEKYGYVPDNASNMSCIISHACRKGTRALGYYWRYDDEPSRGELKEALRASLMREKAAEATRMRLERELGAASARLEDANDRLRDAGLEQA